jgi:DNA-directed RNA polymerase subunit beta
MAKKLINYSNLAQRIDYSKFSTDFFEEPDLLENVKKSYNEKQLLTDLDQLFKLYFPITHAKNTKYIIHYNGILPLVKPKKYVDENEAKEKNLSYEKSLYVDIQIENTETGVIEGVKKAKNGVSDGLFFGNIPCLTKRSTFIINGIEKNVVSQIVRAPGLYYMPSSKFKIFAKKTPIGVCEVYPGSGSMFNVFVKNGVVKIAIASTSRTKIEIFNATELLKAFGMSEDDIKEVYTDNQFMSKSLENFDKSNVKDRLFDKYSRENILNDGVIANFRGELASNKKVSGDQGIFTRVKTLLAQYEGVQNKKSKTATKILDQIVSE